MPTLLDGTTPPPRPLYIPDGGLIPDEDTAVRVAEALMIPIWGADLIAKEGPFRGCLKDGVWTVAGTLPPGASGGTATVKLSKRDGRILDVVHYE